MDLFPYSPRPNQQEFVELVSRAVRDRKHLVLESGTGTGKTVCVLAGCLREVLKDGRKIVYLTRTNSQQRQVIMELRSISRKRRVFGIGVQGRQSTCPLARRDPDLRGGTPEELSRLCGEKKRRTVADMEGGCRFYEATISTGFDEIETYCHEELPTVEEFVKYCDAKGVCPYELTKELIPLATVVTAPYAYFFVPFIRNSLLDWLAVPLSETVVVVDEAHNLPDYAREIRTVNLSRKLLDLVGKEIDEYGDPEIMKGASISDLVGQLNCSLNSALDEYLIDDDGLIPPGLLEEDLMGSFTATSRSLVLAAKALMTHGEIIRERKKEMGRLPRSHIFTLGAFLNFWINLDDTCFVKLIVGGDNPMFEGYCLDPSLAASFLLECGGSVHMSGTLSPLNEYRDSIGLCPEALMESFPSPFPRENRKIFFVEDVSTKYEEITQDEKVIPRLEDYVVSVSNLLNKNTVVFFPSHGLIDRFLKDGVLLRMRRKVHIEERGMPQMELMEIVTRFRESGPKGAVLFAVMGGRISEGLDFPDRELEVAVVAGVPFPKPTAKQRALLHYYEMKFGKGWEYTVRGPACRKMLQAIGRLIRTETDVGAAIILDRRARQFTDRIDLVPSADPSSDLVNFFKERKSQFRPGSKAAKST